MDFRPVLFLDSGIGSFPYGEYFYLRNPAETLVHVADRGNFPYGPKKREELADLLRNLTAALIARYNPKLMAIACNTASVSALDALREAFPALPMVGTVPAVKPAVLASLSRRVGVLGTERTIKDPYIASLASRYGPDCAIRGIAAPELVDFVEHRSLDVGPEERLRAVRPYIEEFRAGGVDAVVLGCTHFLLLLEEFKAAAGEGMGIFDSLDGISRRLETLLEAGNLRSSGGEPPAPALVVTGKAPLEPSWKLWADRYGLSLAEAPEDLSAGKEGGR